jgi:membrane protein implicated in regulation of membrane protease activity
MNIIKIILIILGLILAAFGAMVLVGMAISLLKIVLFLAVVCIVVAFLWKLFSGGSETQELDNDPQTRLQKAELTIEEYKRKLELQSKQGTDKR